MNDTPKRIPPEIAAFTLIELLVVIAIIGILASLLLPVLVSAKKRAKQVFCINNLNQLGKAFQMYQDDNEGKFPAPASAGKYGRHAEDWIWWQQDREIQKSAIVAQLGQFNRTLFTCPQDVEALQLQDQGDLPKDPYRYSYSLTSYNMDRTNAVNPGLSTIITKVGKVYPFYGRQIKNPSAKIMLVEEDRINLNDPRWVPGDDRLTVRHSGRANVVFVDGHVEPVTADFSKDPNHSQPLY